jgi:hypothetical protein
MAGNRVVCPFDKGRYLKQLNDREMSERKLDRLMKPAIPNTLSAGADYDAGKQL